MKESPGSQFFRNNTGIQSGPDAFDKSRFIMIFLTILGVTEVLCSFKLVLERGIQVKRYRLQHMRHVIAGACLCTCLKH